MSSGVRPRPDGSLHVGVVGPGRVGQSLVQALQAAGVTVSGIAGRRPERVSAASAHLGVQALTPIELLERSDLVVITVPDGQIAPVGSHLAGLLSIARRRDGQAVVHCSGAVDLTALAPLAGAGVPVGSWHPLCALPSPDIVVPAGTTWAITSADAELRALLGSLSRALEGIPRLLPEDAKGRYHAAAVLGSNYVVGLLAQAAQLLGDCGLTPQESLQALLPLARSAIDSVQRSGLPDGLTGPLVRGDVDTVRTHLAELVIYPQTLAVYQTLGRATLGLVRGQLAPTIHDEMLDLLGGTRVGSPSAVTHEEG